MQRLTRIDLPAKTYAPTIASDRDELRALGWRPIDWPGGRLIFTVTLAIAGGRLPISHSVVVSPIFFPIRAVDPQLPIDLSIPLPPLWVGTNTLGEVDIPRGELWLLADLAAPVDPEPIALELWA